MNKSVVCSISDNRRQPDDAADLQAKYLCEIGNETRSNILTTLASIFMNQSKNKLALMLLLESLRLKPDQDDCFRLIKSLQGGIGVEGESIEKKSISGVSVIMCTYNRNMEISESILSVLNQTFRDFELIVVNDGGSDEVKKIVDTFKSTKIRYFKLEKNCGHSVALNVGIRNARCRYIAFLDDDDIYYQDHLKILVEAIEKKCHYAAVYSAAWWCYGEIKDGKFRESHRDLNKSRPRKFDINLLLEGNYIANLNLLIKKDCFTKTGMFNEDLARMMDWDLLLRLAPIGIMHQINDITGEYRWKNNNMTVVHKTDVQFLESIIRHHYSYGCGFMALVKYYINHNDTFNGRKTLEEMLLEYDEIIKTPLFLHEVFYFIKQLNFALPKKLMKKITRDYFNLYAKGCLKYALDNKSFKMFSSIIPLLPTRVLKCIKSNILQYLSAYNNLRKT